MPPAGEAGLFSMLPQPHERYDMLFTALFPLAGRRPGATRSANPSTPATGPSADSLRVTATALRAWGAEVDAEDLENRAARVSSS